MDSEEDKVSPENKKRRLKTPSQVEGLENFYAEHKYPSEAMKAQLSVELGLSEKQVQGWFCHRRLKDKRLLKEDAGNTGKQDPHVASIQDPVNGLKQDSSSTGKNPRCFTSKDQENQRFFNVTDYPAAVLASELRDQDLLTGNHDVMEDTFAGSSSASQERSSLQSGNPYEIDVMRPTLQNGNRPEIEGKRRKITVFQTVMQDAYLQEYSEHEAVSAVKEQLGDEYREDGPPLSVEFHPLPPGAFDALIEFHYQSNTFQDSQRLPKKGKDPETGKMFGSEGFHAACSSGARLGYSTTPVGVMFERASPKFERASHFKHESCGKSTWRPENNHLQMGDNYHVPDLNSSMQLDEDSANEVPSPAFITKSYSPWHKQGAVGRPSGEAHLPLLYGSKNGVVPGKVGNMGKETSNYRFHNGVDLHHDVMASGLNQDVKAPLSTALHTDMFSARGEDKAQPKRTTKRERLREEKKVQREQDQAFRLKQKLMDKEERRVCMQIERERQMEENWRQRDISKCKPSENASSTKHQAKGLATEIPTSFSDDEAVGTCSSMD